MIMSSFTLFRAIVAGLATASHVLAAPHAHAHAHARDTHVQPRDVKLIAATTVQPLAQAVPNNATGVALLAYQPYLRVVAGCLPFPAVDSDGYLGEGLEPNGGDKDDGCAKSVGQVYTRWAKANGLLAAMYAWYMPKEENNVASSHKHDWQNIVVWLKPNDPPSDLPSNPAASSGSTPASTTTRRRDLTFSDDSSPALPPWTITGISFSVKPAGSYDQVTVTSSAAAFNGAFLGATHPLVEYSESFGNGAHALGSTMAQGAQQPLVEWFSMPAVAREALTEIDTLYKGGEAPGGVPFVDAHFVANLEASWSDSYY